jgi:hypothetical protein
VTVVASPDIAELDQAVTGLLQQAADYRLIGLLLERPREGWIQQVSELGLTSTDANLRLAAEKAAEAREGVYLDALGPGGVVSPREVGHRVAGDPGHILSEIEGFYTAFAFQPRTEEPSDHISVEAGFMGFLALKEAYAVSSGDAESAQTTREAAEKFRASHLVAFAEPISVALDNTVVDYLALTGKALLSRTGPRPKDLEGYWSPKGLCDVECPMFSCEQDEQEETTLEEIIP